MHSFNGRYECSCSATNERRPSLTQYLTYSTSLPQDAFDFQAASRSNFVLSAIDLFLVVIPSKI